MENVDKNLAEFFADEPPGQKVNSVRWLQKKVMEKARALPRDFSTVAEWEIFRTRMREELPRVIGIPAFPSMKESFVRGRTRLGDDVIVERVDVYVDDDYAVPSFVFSPAAEHSEKSPALMWNPGWPQDKFEASYQKFAERMAKQGYVVLIPDHAPFGETSQVGEKKRANMTLVMGMGHVVGISQLALRSAEASRCGEYLRSRDDVDAARVAISGLCQGGMDTWLTGGMDDGFCAVAPMCSASTMAVHFAEMLYSANADVSPFPFGILDVCDIEHLHAAVAPRPLLVRANLPDNWWPISGLDDIESLTRKVYRLYGCEDKADIRSEVHEHNLTGPFADALEAFLLKYV